MSHMTIGKRLTIGVGALLTVTLALAGSALYWTANLAGDLDGVVSKVGKKMTMISRVQVDFVRLRNSRRGALLRCWRRKKKNEL